MIRPPTKKRDKYVQASWTDLAMSGRFFRAAFRSSSALRSIVHFPDAVPVEVNDTLLPGR